MGLQFIFITQQIRALKNSHKKSHQKNIMWEPQQKNNKKSKNKTINHKRHVML